MGDLVVVDCGDKPICDGSDGIVKVGLGGEDIEGCLRRQWGVSRDNDGGDRIEGDWEDRRLRGHAGWRLIGWVD